MAGIPRVDSDAFLTLVSNALAVETRAYLKAPLMALAEQQIDEAVTKAVDALRPRLQAYVSEHDLTAVINVILTAPTKPLPEQGGQS